MKELQIPLRNLIPLIIAVALGVWGYFSLTERITFLENELANGSDQVEENTKWIKTFEPPSEAIKRVRDLELKHATLEQIVDNHVNRKR